MKKELTDLLTGNVSMALWLACLICAAIAAGAMHKHRINKRDLFSKRTPVAFSWGFFWNDTWPRIYVSFLFTLISLRIMFNWEMATGWYIIISFLLGLLNDRIGKYFEKAADAGDSVVEDKIDEVANKLKSTDAKVNVVKSDVKEIKSDVGEIKKNTE